MMVRQSWASRGVAVETEEKQRQPQGGSSRQPQTLLETCKPNIELADPEAWAMQTTYTPLFFQSKPGIYTAAHW